MAMNSGVELKSWRQFFSLPIVIAWILWLVVGLAPVLLLFADLFNRGSIDDLFAIFSGRELSLLGQSLLLSASVALFSTLITLVLCSRVIDKKGANSTWLLWMPLFLLAVPPYVHATAWLELGSLINQFTRSLGWGSISVTPWLSVVWIEAMSFLPLSIAFAWASLSRVDLTSVDAARMSSNDWRVYWDIRVPQALPMILVGSGVVFLLSMMEFSVPSLFQVRVYALETFLRFNSGEGSYRALISALPLTLLGMVLIWRSVVSPATVGFEMTADRSLSSMQFSPFVTAMQLLAGVVVMAQLFVPVIGLMLAAESLAIFWQTIESATAEITVSLMVAVLAAAVSLIMTALWIPMMENRKGVVLATLPMLIPAPLIGIGLILLWNHPLTDDVYGSIMMPVMASAARFMPIALLLLFFFRRGISREILDAAKMCHRPGMRLWMKIIAPLHAPGLLAAFLAVFALSLGELTATLLVVPAGSGTLSMRIFNLLHYGSSAGVASLCLFVLLVCMVSTLLFLLLASSLYPRWRAVRGDQ